MDLARKQNRLLQAVVGLLKPRARICYSTCSIQGEENERIVQGFLSSNTDFKLEFECLALPDSGPTDHDGGYIAILARND